MRSFQALLFPPPLRAEGWFFDLASCILCLTAGAKLFAVLLLQRYANKPDLVFWFLSQKSLLLFVAAAELATVSVLLNNHISPLAKHSIIFLLASAFLAYRISRAVNYGVIRCPCLGLTTNLSAVVAQAPLPSGKDIRAGGLDVPVPASAIETAAAPADPREEETGSPTPRVAGPSEYVELMTGAGVYNPVYLSGSAFWIVRRDAIDTVVDLATHYRGFASSRGFAADVSACLGYAMQMLCANPELHRVLARLNLWASDELNHFQGSMPDGKPWRLADAWSGEAYEVSPAIIHLPHGKDAGGTNGPSGTKVEDPAMPLVGQSENAHYAHAF